MKHEPVVVYKLQVPEWLHYMFKKTKTLSLPLSLSLPPTHTYTLTHTYTYTHIYSGQEYEQNLENKLKLEDYKYD